MTRTRILLALATFGLAATCGPLLAAEAAAESQTATQKIVDELRDIAARARRERSADPWLLDAMDKLVQRYYWPWRTQALDETFKDGDYTKNPAWEVAAGSFWIDASLGLRSKAAATPAKTETTPARKQKFSDILKEAVREEFERGSNSGKQPASAKAVPVTEIYLPLKVTNAFALDLGFSQHQPGSDEARLEFGVFEAGRGSRGYVLAVISGEEPALELLRMQGSKASIIERASLSRAPATGEAQRLGWRRDPAGNMLVTLNDKPMLETGDRGLNAPFKTLGLINRGGDYAVRKVALFNTQ